MWSTPAARLRAEPSASWGSGASQIKIHVRIIDLDIRDGVTASDQKESRDDGRRSDPPGKGAQRAR